MLGVAIAAAAMGLASIPHCAARCGPLATYASSRGAAAARYHAGRLASYALVGLIAGASGGAIGDALPERLASALLSLILAAALGLAAWRLWRGSSERLVTIGRAPRAPSLVDRAYALVPKSPIALGLMTGVLPCGALYAAALAAAASGSALGGAVSMLSFGVVSGSGLAVVSAVAARVRGLADRGVDPLFLRRVVATALVIGAIVMVVRPIATLTQSEPSCHTSLDEPSRTLARCAPSPARGGGGEDARLFATLSSDRLRSAPRRRGPARARAAGARRARPRARRASLASTARPTG